MHKSLHLVTATALSALAFLACSDEPERAARDLSKTTPSVTETELPGNEQPSDINPITARLRISDIKVGTALNSEGCVADDMNTVHPGDVLLASIAVGDVGAESKIKAVWVGPNGQRISDEIQSVRAGDAYLVFRAPATVGWAVGAYEVEIYLGDELAGSNKFNLAVPTAS